MKKSLELERKLQGYSRSATALRLVRKGLHSKGIRYSTAVAAGAAMAGGSADAALITSPFQGFTSTVTGTFTGGPIDIDGDFVPDFYGYIGGFASYFSGTPSSPGFYLAYNFFNLSSGNFANRVVSNVFQPGDATTSSVSESTFFSASLPGGAPSSTRTRTFAFSFFAGTNTSVTPNTGWLRAVIEFRPNQTRVSFPTVVYNTTPDASVHVGSVPAAAVPEPSGVALTGLGLLALGVREWRRRRKKGETKA